MAQLVIITGCVGQSYSPGEIDLEAEKQLAVATFDSIFVAFATRDSSIAKRILTEDCLWTEQRSVRGCIIMNRFVKNLIEYDRRIHIDSTDVSSVTIKGPVAWIILSNNQTWEVDGEIGAPKKWRHSGVLVKQEGKWRVAQYHGHDTTQ